MKKQKRLWRSFLRPRSGHRLPAELAPEKVWSLSASLPEGLADSAFETLLRRIEQSPILSNNRVHVFFDGSETFDAMLADIAAAKSEVLIESYIFKDDETGRRFLRALGEAARRGAAVRVLADALGSFGTKAGFWREMEMQGIEARLFHPLSARIWTQFFRDHRKILVVDRAIGYTGGMNIGNEYGSSRLRKRSEGTWRDTHSRVEGPAAWEMAIVFSEAWIRAGGRPFEIAPIEPPPPGGAAVLVMNSRPGRGHAEAASALAAIVGAARKTLWITNPYFAPRRRAVDLLCATGRRGIDVRLLLAGRSDAPLVRHAGHGRFNALLRAGVRIFEYESAILHAKTLVADDYVALVGSTNLDFRSFRFNAECNVVIFDGDTAARLKGAYEEDLAQSTEITEARWNDRPLAHRFVDALACRASPLL